MMRYVYLFLLIFFALAGQAKTVARVMVDSQKPLAVDQHDELVGYLQRYISVPAEQQALDAARSFIQSLKFVENVRCAFKEEHDVTLICHVIPKHVIASITTKGLPFGLLESELKRKLPIQVGQLFVPHDKGFSEILSMSNSRVETFLRKNGFYGASIEIELKTDEKSINTHVVFTINNGSFARVNNVILEGNSPVSARTVALNYKRMCLSFNHIFDAFSMGSINCFSREIEREATSKLQERLAKQGYVQARIGLTHHWLDPHDPKIPKYCQKADPQDTVPICVDLSVRINPGPKVRWNITMREGTMVSRWGITRFWESIFAADQLSRLNRALDEETPPDQAIIKEELEKRINFIETKSVAEAELKESAQKMREYLVNKGYTNAEVIPSYYVEDKNNIIINFDVYSGDSYYVKNFRIEPEYVNKLFSENERDELIKKRSMRERGQLSYKNISDALDEVKRRLTEQGFRNVEGKTEMNSLDDRAVEVIFYITSTGREIINSLAIINGDEDLNKEIMPFLRNCAVFHEQPQDMKMSCTKSPLDRGNIVIDEKKIADFYTNNDFLYASVKSDLKKSDKGYDLLFYVYDNRKENDYTSKLERQKIKNIIVSGNETTNLGVIKRLFPVASHGQERFDSVSLKKGLSLLRESGHFSNIDSKILTGEKNSEDAYFAIHVTEKPSLNLDLALAFSTDELLSVELDLEENNLFSSLLKLNTSVGLGLFWGRQSYISNKFVWPFMFGSPLRFGIQAPVIVYDDKSSRQKPFRRLQSKVIASLEWRLSQTILPYIRYSLIHTQRQELDSSDLQMSLTERFRSLDGLVPVLKAPEKIRGLLKPGISIINLDNPANPHAGVDTNHWVELSGGPLIGTPAFINVGTQNKFYIPLGPTTLALQATFMRAFMSPSEDNWKNISDVSAIDNLGGDRRGRGYQEGAITPLHRGSRSNIYGGYLLNSSNIEWRFPLTNPELLGNFAGALFLDQEMILVCDDFGCDQKEGFSEVISHRGFGFSAGLGIRYNLPVGPISLDYAYAPLQQDWRVHLQFGYAF